MSPKKRARQLKPVYEMNPLFKAIAQNTIFRIASVTRLLPTTKSDIITYYVILPFIYVA